MAPHTRYLLCAAVVLSVAVPSLQALRWCTSSGEEQVKCKQMTQAFALVPGTVAPSVTCVEAFQRYSCLRMINESMADVTSVSDTEMYAGGKLYDLVPFMHEKTTTGNAHTAYRPGDYTCAVSSTVTGYASCHLLSPENATHLADPNAETFRYKAVIVVRASDTSINSLRDLRGKKSCHTEVGKTTGWTIPVSTLYAKKIMAGRDCDSNVRNVANFFSASCAPGAFSEYYNPDNNNPGNICGRCAQNRCPTDDEYAGYEGAFKCLVQGRGDVAFVKHSTVPTDAKGKFTYDQSDYHLLCPDNTRMSVSEWNQCNWAVRPSNPLVTRRNNPDLKSYKFLLDNAVKTFGPGTAKTFKLFESQGGKNLLFSDDTKTLSDTGSKNTYTSYLDEGYRNSMEKIYPCQQAMRWCVISEPEEDKCQDMRTALMAGRITASMSCVRGRNAKDCMEKIRQNKADVVTLDQGDIYLGGKMDGMQPIMAETYTTDADATNYWAVAVVRKNNPSVTINNLYGKTSCHTGIGKTAGWNVPVGFLMQKGNIKVKGCDVALGVGKFFSKSCAPGALDKSYNPSGRNPENLCDLCGGPSRCQRDNSNPYYDYHGAFRCLIEKNADVAFVKHTTVLDNTDGKNKDSWAANLRSGDYELLCKDGTRRPVTEWRYCNLAQLASHAVATHKDRSREVKRHYQVVLHKAQLLYKDSATFKIFSSAKGKNLLFKDSTVKLTPLSLIGDYRAFLKDGLLESLNALDEHKCYTGRAASILTPFSLLVTIVIFSLNAIWW